MPLSDVLTRLGAAAMVISALWNLVMSAIWFISLVWVLVGLLWLVPMALAVVCLLFAAVLLVLGHNKACAAGPVLSFVVSICNFNFIGGFLDFIALCLMVGSYVARSSEAQAEVAFA